MAKIIKVTIDDANGEFDVDLSGFHGKGCDALIKAFGEIGSITSETHKPEYNENVTVNRTAKLGQ